jgi:Xaa-Pro aminopeptidase
MTRIHKVRDAMKKYGLDVLIVYSDSWRPGNVRYLSNYRAFNNTIVDFPRYIPSVSVLLPIDDDPILFVSAQTLPDANEKSWLHNIKPWKEFGDELNKLRSDGSRIRKVGIEGASIIPAQIYGHIEKKLHDIELQPTDIIPRLRITKSKMELEYMEKAAKIVDEGMKTAVETIGEGKKEVEIARTAEIAMLSEGAGGFGFDTLVMSGPRSAYTISPPTDRRIESGDMILIDMSARYMGYCSDLSRGIAFGQISKEKREILRVNAEAHAKARSLAGPGIEVGNLNVAIKGVLEEAGFEKYRIQGGFHGIGMEFGEPLPSDTILEKNMTIVIVSAVPVPGIGGTRIEDDLVITEDGARLLTNFEREIYL